MPTDLSEWIPLRDAVEIHSTLTIRMLDNWTKTGVQTRAETKRIIYLPCKVIGRARHVRRQDVLDFLEAQQPTASKALIERFAG